MCSIERVCRHSVCLTLPIKLYVVHDSRRFVRVHVVAHFISILFSEIRTFVVDYNYDVWTLTILTKCFLSISTHTRQCLRTYYAIVLDVICKYWVIIIILYTKMAMFNNMILNNSFVTIFLSKNWKCTLVDRNRTLNRTIPKPEEIVDKIVLRLI